MADRNQLDRLLVTNSLVEVAEALRNDQVSVFHYLEAVQAKLDTLEPQLHALVPETGRFERLRRQAAQLVEAYPHPQERPALFGVLTGIKDIYHVNGLPTRAGSQLPAPVLAGEQGATVSALERAGALVLGKTVTTEFAYFAPGPTRNPRHPDHTPGGSSSGSAAAVAAGFCPLALGSQTIGSIIRPAAFCGVVGFKPSYNRISTGGLIPLAPSVDHVGLFTQDAASMRLAAKVLIPDWDAPQISARPVLGIPVGPFLERASERARRHLEWVVERMVAQGWQVKRVEAMPDFAEIEARHKALVAAEAAAVHAKWYAEHAARYHPTTAELIARGRTIPEPVVEQARRGRAALRAELMRLMDEHAVNLWLCPAAIGAAPRGLASTGDPIMNLPWTYSGLPVITLPADTTNDRLPLGIQLIGKWFRDAELLEWAVELEASLKTIQPASPPALI